MLTHVIPPHTWPSFLDTFSRDHEGALIMMEVAERDGGQRVEARNLPFEGAMVDLDTTLRHIVLFIGRRAGAHITHRIVNPVSMMWERVDGRAVLRIRSHDGDETVVRFPGRADEQGDIFYE